MGSAHESVRFFVFCSEGGRAQVYWLAGKSLAMGVARNPLVMGRISTWSDFVQKKARTKVCAFLYFAQGEQGASLLACGDVASDGVCAKAGCNRKMELL